MLEQDPFLFQLYSLANDHHWPLSVVRQMTLSEFEGWIAFRDLNRLEMHHG